MRYVGEEETTQVMGLGCAGQVAQGMDGNLYQWVQGTDGLGNPVGFWQRWAGQRRPRSHRAWPRRFRQYTPVPMVPVAPQMVCPPPPPVVAAVATPQAVPATPTVAPTAMHPAGATAPTVMPGAPAAPAVTATAGWGLGEEDVTRFMGLGYPGEVRTGPDGNLYQWVQGVDGLGNPVGWGWALRRLRRVAKRLAPLAQRLAPLIPGGAALTALRVAAPLLRRVVPLAQRLAPLVPGPYGAAVATALRTATPVLQQAGITGANGLGALYQAPDGTVYQVQGLAEDEELRGLAEEEELRGFAEDEELRGLAEDEELRGLAEEEELRGFAEDEELRGLTQAEELQGLSQGYVREAGTSGLEAYAPEQPPQTRWFASPAQPPEMWKPLW